jgi:hypothetical protein
MLADMNKAKILEEGVKKLADDFMSMVIDFTEALLPSLKETIIN